MRELGGVGKVMPITAITMAIAALSLAGFGIPGTSIGTSGFLSKDPIIETAYLFGEHSNNWLPYLFSIAAALLTSIYIFRLIFMTFTGKPRSDYHGHESPAIMTIPLSILALFALGFGIFSRAEFYAFLEDTFTNSFVNLNIGNLAAIGQNKLLVTAASTGAAGGTGSLGNTGGNESTFVLWLPVLIALAGLVIAFLSYYLRVIKLGPLASMKNPIYRLLYKRYYQHEIYTEFFALGIVYGIIASVARFIDIIIDSIVEGIGILTVGISDELRRVQTGVVQNYAAITIAGVGLLIVLIKLITEVF
jgi:NADH-quinone oxidoreductase subunit L